jgi:hypothetical protein
MSQGPKDVNVNFGGGFFGLLTIVLITLKLTGYIDWSWWWVLAPLWIGTAIGLFFLAIFFTLAVWIEGRR